jgi:hypothetical protein
MKDFHLPLPERTWEALRAESERAQLPATTIAREAISNWLRARKRFERRKAVMEYATAMAGTRFDLDPALECAAIEEMMRTAPETKRNGGQMYWADLAPRETEQRNYPVRR